MKCIVFIFFIVFFSTNIAFADELMPVLNSLPAFEIEEVKLEVKDTLKYKLQARQIDTYYSESKKEAAPSFKKGRLSFGTGISSKKDRHNNKFGDKVLLKPNIKVTDEFSLLFLNKVDAMDIHSHSQEVGLNYAPKKMKGTNFSVMGSGDETKQKMKFSTDFYFW